MKEEIKNKEEKKEHKDKKKEKKEEVVKLTKEEIEAINKKASDAEDEALRAKAELINYRKRKDEEVERLLKFANEDLIVEFLPTLDNFERAINMDDDNLEDDVSKFLSGMKMVYNALVSTLEKYGVKEIKAEGEKFDANLHEAVITESKEGIEEDVILEVFQKGYTLKDKVIRPAMVKVNK